MQQYRTDLAGSDLINGGYGLHLYPAGQDGFIELAYMEQFGVCGMDLEEEQTEEDAIAYGEQAWQILDTLQYDPDDLSEETSIGAST